jgi:hypothetical protein
MTLVMNARYLSDYSFDGYQPLRKAGVALHRDRFNFRSLFESIGWVLAGATVGCTAVMLGAWGLLQVLEAPSPSPVATAMVYQAPTALPQ